jgi:N-acetylglucosamine kinase-like BadF-type ATPase
MEIILAIDGGGSRTRCLALDRRGAVLGEGSGGPSNHLLVPRETAKTSIGEALERSCAPSGLKNEDVVCVSAGTAGVDYDGAGAEEVEVILHELGFGRLVVVGDMVIAHAGALGGRPGVVALAGTGSSVLGIGPDGTRVKVGGWGPVYGDEGSAYRIGRMALTAAAMAYDGRGAATALTGALLRALDLRDFRETVTRVYVQGMEPREVAALSRVVYEVAESGDAVARDIFLKAGEELADAVEAAARRLDMGESEVRVSYEGAVLTSCALVRDRFCESLGERLQGVSVLPPLFEPVVGAYLLGRAEVGWPNDAALFDALEEWSGARRPEGGDPGE